MNSTALSRLAGSIVVGTAMVLLAANHQARGELEFGIPTPFPEPINNENGNTQPWISPDGNTIFFTSTRPGGSGPSTIWTSTRTSSSADWEVPVIAGEQIDTPAFDIAPSATADTLELYFHRTTDPLGLSDSDIYVAKRNTIGEDWAVEPFSLNTVEFGESHPSVSPDGREIYFSIRREISQSPVLNNVYVSRRNSRDEPFGAPEYVAPGFGPLVLSLDGFTRALYINQGTAEILGLPSVGGADIFLQTRESIGDEFGPIRNPGSPLNSGQTGLPSLLPGYDQAGTFSSDGSLLYFGSTRPGVSTSPDPFSDLGIWQAPIAEAVPVDIKPGSDPNSVNLKSKGVLPVAILSTDEFDALNVDPETLVFGDPLLIANGEGTPVSPLRWAYEDVTGDSLMDLTLKFSTPELVDKDVLDSATMQGYLTGTLKEGTVIAGRDAIRIVGSKVVPEPSTFALIGICLLCLLAYRHRQSK